MGKSRFQGTKERATQEINPDLASELERGGWGLGFKYIAKDCFLGGVRGQGNM